MKSGVVTARAIPWLALLILLLSACGMAPSTQEIQPTPIPTPLIPVKPVYKVTAGEVVRKLQFTGRVAPVVQQELYFKINGRVARVHARQGDSVQAGQLLAELETSTSALDVRRAEINLEMAKLNKEMALLQTSKYALNYNILLKMKDYDIELAQLALDEIKARADTAQIKAPFDGTLLSVNIDPAQVVQAYQTKVVIADLNAIEVSADLGLQDMANLQEGMPALVSPLNRPGAELKGTLSKLPYPYGKPAPVGDTGKPDSATHVTMIDDLAIDNLTLGDLVKVVVILEKKDNVLWLPPQAIRRFEGRQFVVVQEDAGQRRVDIKTGIAGDDRVEISDGLAEGWVIVTP